MTVAAETGTEHEQRVQEACWAMQDALYADCHCTADYRIVDGAIVWDYGWDPGCRLHGGGLQVGGQS